MHPEIWVPSKLIEDSVKVASRLLQDDRGNMMIATDFTADSISSLYCSGYNPPFSARERIPLLVADLMLSGGFG